MSTGWKIDDLHVSAPLATGFGYSLEGYSYIQEICLQPGLHRLVMEDKLADAGCTSIEAFRCTDSALMAADRNSLIQAIVGDVVLESGTISESDLEKVRVALEDLKVRQGEVVPAVPASESALVNLPTVAGRPAVDTVAAEGYRHGAVWDSYGWKDTCITIWRTGQLLLNETMKMQATGWGLWAAHRGGA